MATAFRHSSVRHRYPGSRVRSWYSGACKAKSALNSRQTPPCRTPEHQPQIWRMTMRRRDFLVSAVAAASAAAYTGCTTTSGSGESAATDMAQRQAIAASVDGTLSRLYTSINGSRELVSKAQ